MIVLGQKDSEAYMNKLQNLRQLEQKIIMMALGFNT
jgi:hypothetical protein